MNILITGSASGIGYDVGIKLSKLGHHVFLTVEDDKQLEVLREKIKDMKNIGAFKLDVTNKKDREILENFDIDVLISNAAIGQGGSIMDIDMKKIRKCYDTNVFYNFDVIKITLDNMLKKNKGKIIIISSIVANIPVPFFGIYASTKASISMLASCLKKELKFVNKDIKIKIIEPGIYKTGFNRVMIENGMTDKYYLFNKSVNDFEKELLNFVGSSNLNSISNKIICAINDESNKTIYRAPFLQNVLIKLYIKIFKK